MPKNFLSQLNWRYAVKNFDPQKKVSQKDLNQILEAIRMTPTSFGLQALHTVVVSNQQLKKKLKAHSFMQSQVSDASHVLVLCARYDVESRVEEYLKLVARERKLLAPAIKPIKMVMSRFIKAKDEKQVKEWANRQVYIALGFAMAACAELEIDSCPMEGFSSDKVNQLLDLPASMSSVLLLPVGYRAHDSKKAKVRFDQKDLFTFKD